MEGAQAPDNIHGVDTNNGAAGETLFQHTHCLIILPALKIRDDYRFVGDVKIRVGSWKPLVIIDHWFGHANFGNVELLTI